MLRILPYVTGVHLEVVEVCKLVTARQVVNGIV